MTIRIFLVFTTLQLLCFSLSTSPIPKGNVNFSSKKDQATYKCPSNGYSYSTYGIVNGYICGDREKDFNPSKICFKYDSKITLFYDYPYKFPKGATGMKKRKCTIRKFGCSKVIISCSSTFKSECEDINASQLCNTLPDGAVYIYKNQCKCRKIGNKRTFGCTHPISLKHSKSQTSMSSKISPKTTTSININNQSKTLTASRSTTTSTSIKANTAATYTSTSLTKSTIEATSTTSKFKSTTK
ncbi:hypothetical protein BB560_003137, partial [Smittium megazygosporum]